MRSPYGANRRSGLGLALVATTIIALTASACGAKGTVSDESGTPTTPTTMAPQPGGKIVYGIEADPNGLDATRNAWDPSGLLVADAIFDTLSAIDAEGKTQPYLAKSFEHDDAYLVWTINLREGVRFHDGTAFDGTAAVTFFKALMASAITGPPTKYIQDVKSTDPLSVTVTMNRPWAAFP